MIKRPWTAVAGYMLAYALFNYNYPIGSRGRANFPRERIPYRIVGFVCFFAGYTEIGTWVLRKMADLAKYTISLDVFDQLYWIVFEIIYWYCLGLKSIDVWADVGDFYKQSHKKMFAFSVSLAASTKYVNYFFMAE